MTKALMFMGTGSDVGKSLIVAGLCRVLANRGLSVSPFKPQNMSNNAAVTADGGEIGRAQALQALAARKPAATAMNPVLLKPEGETGSQVVVRGVRRVSMSARDYFTRRSELMPEVLAAFSELCRGADYIIVEGAGSASEVNLRDADIANFGFAQAADIPVVLIGDIERGGVIASIVGTFAVIRPDDSKRLVATLINKFQGDPSLFDGGRHFLAERTGRPVFGPVPMFTGASRLPAEDILGLIGDSTKPDATLRIAVPRLPRISNFDDLDPLRAEPSVSVKIVSPGTPIPLDTDIVILPGSKSTRSDLAALVAEGWDTDIKTLYRAGRRIVGLCGGYQMLGRSISDPLGIEGPPGTSDGLGLLDVETVLTATKQLRVENARHLRTGTEIRGYHMHMGETEGGDRVRPFADIDGIAEGACSADGRVSGTYLHGVFASDSFRRAFLDIESGDLDYDATIEQTLDDLAAHLEAHLDIDALLSLAKEV